MKAVGIGHLAAMLEQKFEFAEGEARKSVETFFQVIADNLKTQKYVKIKGLGVFKLIDGEEQGMRRIVFTPEQMLKEVVNKPFSHFEPVTLNDGVELGTLHMEETNDGESGAEMVTLEEGREEGKSLGVVVKEGGEEKQDEGGLSSVQATEEAVKNQEQQSMRIKRREQSLIDKEERDGSMFFVIIVLIGVLAVVLALVFLLAPEWIEKMVYGSVSPLKPLE